MILAFKEHFIPLILSGEKIHTIREDSNDRWGKGALINFATGIKSHNYKEHLKKECVSTQSIEIYWNMKSGELTPTIFVDSRELNQNDLSLLAKNDGFETLEDFLSWDSWNKRPFKGKIIHWTDKRY